MCGICGYWAAGEYADSVIGRMNAVMESRGPDSEGYFAEGRFRMAMRRLAIIDLTTGDQPVSNRDGSLAIIFNGEVYNYRELRDELLNAGMTFRTNGDTEVILVGFEKWGEDVFQRLNGMFSVAIYDGVNEELVLARDRLGIKPLYYYTDAEHFVFGSIVQSIVQHPAYSKRVDYTALNSLLRYKYVIGERSLFEGIRSVKPGHVLRISQRFEVCSDRAYWSLGDYVRPRPMISSLDEAKRAVEDAVVRSVQRRLIADVPVGLFLSGGIDSAILAHVATRLSGAGISTYSIGFEERTYNELPFARLTAEFNGTEHHELTVTPQNVVELVDEIVRSAGEPLGDYAQIPNYLVSKFAAEDVKVALSGAGADELFGGYERYFLGTGASAIAATPSWVLNLLLLSARSLPSSQHKKSLRRRSIKFLENAKAPMGHRYDHTFRMLSDHDISGLLTAEVAAQVGRAGEPTVEQVFDHYPKLSFLTRASVADMLTILPNNYLVKEDRTSMANSLEVRVPYLDHDLVELSFEVADHLKIRGLKTKFILKEAFSDRIPKAVLNRPKQGFEAPFSIWLRDHIRKDVSTLLGGSALVEDNIVRPERLKAIQEEHHSAVRDHTKLLFTLLSLELWYRCHFSSS